MLNILYIKLINFKSNDKDIVVEYISFCFDIGFYKKLILIHCWTIRVLRISFF